MNYDISEYFDLLRQNPNDEILIKIWDIESELGLVKS